ncbi:hypothetical protein [Pseudoxanthomonas mexicana]
MRKFYLLFLLCVTGVVNAQDWTLKTTTDSMTDATTREAVLTLPTGESFAVMRRSDNSVWGYYRPATGQLFAAGDHLLVRVDKSKPVEFSDKFEQLSQRLGKKVEMWDWNPTLIATRIWHGNPSEGCGLIQQLINGQQMVIRNHPNESTYRDVTFPLSGDKKALVEALDFDVANCPPPRS